MVTPTPGKRLDLDKQNPLIAGLSFQAAEGLELSNSAWQMVATEVFEHLIKAAVATGNTAQAGTIQAMSGVSSLRSVLHPAPA